MKLTLLLFHATMFWIAFMVLSLSNSFMRNFIYEPLAGKLWSQILTTSILIVINAILILYFFVQKTKFKKQVLSSSQSKQEGLFSFERKRNMLLVGLWWILLTFVFELIMGWIQGLVSTSSPGSLLFGSSLSFISVSSWTKSHAVWLLLSAQIVFPIVIGTLVFRLDDKRAIGEKDLKNK